jgi:hypothetical protein
VSYPVACPLASSATVQNTRKDAGSRPVPPTKDLRSSSHLSARQLASIRERLSGRDLDILEVVARFRAMGGQQLQRLFWESAGINRHGEANERFVHRRSSESRWPRAMRWCPARAQRSVGQGCMQASY